MWRLDRVALGQALADGRARWRMTLRDVEAATGVSRSTISRAERGSADAFQSAQNVLVLCWFYRLDPLSFLVDGEADCGGEDAFHVHPPVRQPLAGG